MSAAERLAAALADIQMFTQRPKRDALMLAQSLVAVDPTLAQDIEDGAALRRLREALPVGFGWVRVEWVDDEGWLVTATHEDTDPDAPDFWGRGKTLAQAADACREAIEAQR